MIDVLDYGMGNSGSVIRMIEKVGGSARRISTPEEIMCAHKLIIPGVGHFDSAMQLIVTRGLLEPLRERLINQGIPVLGICLGMQLLCMHSEEGKLPGMGFVAAEVRKFISLPNKPLKIPHMGWNEVEVVANNSLINLTGDRSRFYFAHSYYVEPYSSDLIVATASYGVDFCAAFQSENILGVQFHPEKSHRFGMALISRFVGL